MKMSKRTSAACNVVFLVGTCVGAAQACPDSDPVDTPLSPPSNGAVVQGFGPQPHPLLKIERFHPGLDYSARIDDPVYAARAGTVLKADWLGEYGQVVVITHSSVGLETRYGHLRQIAVKEGDCVSRGALIGRAGATGLAPGPRVHFEVRRDGQPVDPTRHLASGN